MKKRKLLLTFAASGLVATTAAAILASGGIKVNPFANDSETWTHYSGIGSTIYERGSKEYWVSCSSHSHQFTAPASGNIQEGTEAANFQNALELDDDRLIRNKSSFDFEDGNYDVIDQAGSVNINSFQIVNEGVNGSKALKANNSAYVTGRGIKFKKAWLDMAFANSGTEAILFDVLSSVATKYFGYKTNGVYNRYEADDSNTGVSTVFKTFAFTRAMYETASSIEYIIGTDQAIGATYYVVDNIRLGKAIDETKCVDFSSGKLASDSNYVFTYRNNQAASWKTKSFIGTGNGVDKTNSGYDYTVKSAGLRSFKAVLLGGYCSFGINGPLVESIPDGGSLMFDVNVSSNISSVAWTGSAASWVYTGWRTITITKANLAAATKIDTYLYPICVINGTSTGNMYFDNFRIKGNSTVTDFDFEDAAVNTSYPKYICNTANVGAFTYADVNYGFYLETSTSAFSVGVSTDQAYTGSKSVKFSSTSNYAGYSALHLNETFCNGAPAAGIEFNVLALNGGTMHDMLDVNGVKVGKAGGKWQTVRIAKANIGTKGTILSGNNMLAGDYYFDNVHYAA